MVVIAARDNEGYFTPEEYFAWEEQQLERHELIERAIAWNLKALV
jgi:hypothetical protein